MILVALPSYASDLDVPLPPAPRFRLRAKNLKPRVRRLENVLAIGNWLFKSIRGIENNWRTEVLERTTPFDPNEALSILEFFRQWGIPCGRIEEEIRALESKGAEVQGADAFRRYRLEAEEILAGDNSFFEDAEKAGRWTAITAAHRQPYRAIQVDEDGRLFEMSGERFNMPGLTPADIREAREDERAGRMRPLKEIVASRKSYGI
jgi:hypothetical protein